MDADRPPMCAVPPRTAIVSTMPPPSLAKATCLCGPACGCGHGLTCGQPGCPTTPAPVQAVSSPPVVVRRPATFYYAAPGVAGNCPGGVCPTPRR